jgi:cupin 2 domain-containing protein
MYNSKNLTELEERILIAGDYISFPSRKKHYVEWTDPEPESIWSAIFY